MSNLSTLPKGDSAWLLRKAIERIMEQVSVLETNIGSSTTGNSANTQIIFNDNGTLRGDTGLTYNKTTDVLSFGAGICYGDLTVDTSTLKVDSGANKVGIGTTTMNGVLTVKNPNVAVESSIYAIQAATSTSQLSSWTINQNTDVVSFGTDFFGALSLKTNSVERYNIGTTGISTWSVAGTTAMTLNSTGLGVGIAPESAKSTRLSVYQTGDLIDETAPLSVGNTAAGGMRLYAGVNNTNEYVYIGSVKSGTGYRSMILQPNGGNVGIGVTPSAWGTGGSIQLPAGAGNSGIFTSNRYAIFGSNAYNNAGWKYIASEAAAMYVQDTGSHAWFNATGGTAGNAITWTTAMTLDASGNLLVGLTTALGGKIGAQVEGGNGAAYLLRHNGATAGKYRIFAIDASNNGLFYDQNNVGMYMADAGTSWVATSDETQKDIIEPISNAISKVGSLRAVIGKFKTDANSVRRPFLIAQDVQAALPEAVHQKDGLLGLSYTDVIPLLVAAIKELTAEVNALKNA